MKEGTVFVGIDVSRERLDMAVRPTGEVKEVPNTPAGISSLAGFLNGVGPGLVVLEATGGMEALVAAELASGGLRVVVVNPLQVRDFARAAGKLAKTDSLDAHALAHFGEAVRAEVAPLPDATARELVAMVARRRQLVEMIAAEGDRLRTATRRIRPQVQEHIRWMKDNLEQLDLDLDDTIRSSPMWKDKDQVLRSTPGVGTVLSMTLLSEMAELGALNCWQIAALVGVGAVQPGQRYPEGKTQGVGRSQAGPGCALHGNPGCHPVQSRAPGLLPTPLCCWETEEGGPYRLHA